MLKLQSAGWKRLASLRGETITGWFLFQEGNRQRFRFKGEEKQGQETEKRPPLLGCIEHTVGTSTLSPVLWGRPMHHSGEDLLHCRPSGHTEGFKEVGAGLWQDGAWWLGKIWRDGGRRQKKQTVSLLFHPVITDTGGTNLAACPTTTFLTPVPCFRDTTLHLYLPSLVIKGWQLLLSFPISPFCWLMMPVIIRDSLFTHFQLANNF